MNKYFIETEDHFIISPNNKMFELHFSKKDFKTIESVITELAKLREKNKKNIININDLLREANSVAHNTLIDT